MVSVLAIAILAGAAGLYLWGEIMRGGLPKFDLILASVAAAPVAVQRGAPAAPPPADPVPFFSAPLVTFGPAGAEMYLTAPDVLALISSAVLLIRFTAWAVTGAVRGCKGG